MSENEQGANTGRIPAKPNIPKFWVWGRRSVTLPYQKQPVNDSFFKLLATQRGKANQQQEQLVGPLVSWPKSWHAEGVTTAWRMSTGPSNARTNLVSSAPANRPNSWALPSYSPVFDRIDAHLLHQGHPGLQTPHSGLLMWGISQWDAEVDWDPCFFFFFLVCLFVGLADQSIKRVDLLTGNPQTPIDVMMKCWVIEQTCSVCFDRSSSSWKKAGLWWSALRGEKSAAAAAACSAECLSKPMSNFSVLGARQDSHCQKDTLKFLYG